MTETRVAVIGTGAIGSAVTRRLLACGHPVTVWNRTPSRATGLVDAGAVQAASIREAVAASDLVLLTLTDHTAVRACLADAGDLTGRTVVAMTTGSAADARAAADLAAGARYLDVGLQSPPEAIGTDAAVLLYSGSREAFNDHADLLTQLGTARFVGDAPDAAAIWDLALFGVWYDAQLGLLRALDTVRAAGMDTAEFAATAAAQLGHVVTAAHTTAEEVTHGEYPAGPASLVEHLPVLHHLIDLRSNTPLGDGGLSTVAARITTLIAEGHGTEGLTAAAVRDLDRPAPDRASPASAR